MRFTNSDGTPLSITSATLRAARMEDRISADSKPEELHLISLTFQLVNNTERRIVGAVFRHATSSSSNAISASVKIEPHSAYKLELPTTSRAFVVLRGSPDGMEARVSGVRFEDGEVWGTLLPLPPPPPEVAPAPVDPKLVRKSGGVLMTSATHRVEAEYPPLARAARIKGSVVVEVTVDEAGAVISAQAISGHPLLKDSAVSAARQWQFTPTMLSGVPVKVIGTLTFFFEP